MIERILVWLIRLILKLIFLILKLLWHIIKEAFTFPDEKTHRPKTTPIYRNSYKAKHKRKRPYRW